MALQDAATLAVAAIADTTLARRKATIAGRDDDTVDAQDLLCVLRT